MSKKFSGMQERLGNFQERLAQKVGAQEANDRQIVEIPIEELRPAPWNARRYFDENLIARLGADLKKNGQIQAIVVRHQEDAFEIVVGNRRFHAAPIAGLQTLRAEIWTLDDAAARYLSLAENLQREDINPYEETLGYTQLLQFLLKDEISFRNFKHPEEADEHAIERLLRRYANEIERIENNVILTTRKDQAETHMTKAQILGTPMESLLMDVFSTAGHMTPLSFVKNRLPLLKMPPDVISAVQSGRLEYTKARKISQLKDQKARQALLVDVVEQGLSLEEITTRIRVNRDEITKQNTNGLDVLALRSRAITQAIKRTRALGDKRKLRKAQKLVSELEALLEIPAIDKE